MTGASLTVTGTVSDVGAGVAAVTCNGMLATVDAGTLSCEVPLGPGRTPVVVEVVDVAGGRASHGVMVTRTGTPSALRITPVTRTLLVGEASALLAANECGPEEPATVTWASDPEAVATIDATTGLLTAVGAGTATVTATVGTRTAEATVTVLVGTELPMGTTLWQMDAPVGVLLGLAVQEWGWSPRPRTHTAVRLMAMKISHGLSALTAACGAVAAFGCTYDYVGTVAELVPAPGVTVTMAVSRYGDCYRDTEDVPVVYTVTRPAYTLRIAHGRRYWPGLYAVAKDNQGNLLELGGQVMPVDHPKGGDMRRLQEARGTQLTHGIFLNVPLGWDARTGKNRTVEAVRSGRLPVQAFAVDVVEAGRVIGHEEFRYFVTTIHCSESDGP